MSNRKTPGTTVWVDYKTRDALNRMKHAGETSCQLIRRLLGGKR